MQKGGKMQIFTVIVPIVTFLLGAGLGMLENHEDCRNKSDEMN